ncbi:MAG: site-specific integrase [Nitrospinae bacterium]|nr:site-specific integrase [Nitrospinota bacterium]
MTPLRQLMTDNLELRGLAKTTIKDYIRQVASFANYFGKTPVELREAEVRAYLLYLTKEKKLASSSVNRARCAIKFLYEDTLDNFKIMRNIPKTKPSRVRLPLVLNKSEIKAIFAQITNLKHLAILQLIYSSGLRISEAANLNVTDIHSDTMRLHVRLGKGAKERYTKLSKTALITLRDYWRESQPKEILFTGQKRDKPIHTASIALTFKKAKAKAGIQKPATVHTLRHSFASHLLDQGEKLATIQKLLGHHSIKSTAIYLHVSPSTFDKVLSPLDSEDF